MQPLPLVVSHATDRVRDGVCGGCIGVCGCGKVSEEVNGMKAFLLIRAHKAIKTFVSWMKQITCEHNDQHTPGRLFELLNPP